MVVKKMMRWPPWPPLPPSRKIEATILLRRLEGLLVLDSGESAAEKAALVVEIKWKGQKGTALSSLRRSVKRNFTKEVSVGDDGVVELDEEFRSLCNLVGNKEGLFPWEVTFTVFNGLNRGPSNKVLIVGTALLNLAEFAPIAEEEKLEINIPLVIPAGTVECRPSLCLSVSLLELRTAHEPSETVQRSAVPFPLSPCSAALSVGKDELSALKAGLRKVKNFRNYVSARKAKKACHEEESSDSRPSVRSEDAECTYPIDIDSLADDADRELEETKEASTARPSLSYETLANAKCVGGLLSLNATVSNEYEDLVYYSNRKSDDGCLYAEEDAVSKQSSQQTSKRRILSWRKRKLGFRSPKAKGEPLLKKDCGEEGGDDIDFYRRQLNSSDESSYGWHKSDEGSTTSRSSVSDFGDDNFAVGSWEKKEVISRDRKMKLQTQVFYASIDQRSERAAGESACTALVAVIADWLLSNGDEMPIKSEFDNLIRDGSLEWRNLCENEAYKEQFPDKHFDLETILQAKIRPLSVVPEKSFIGFFHPEEQEEGGFDFLQGAMSFDNIWDEISRLDCLNNGVPLVYIVSWNDHFFVLRVERDAYYIIDTLGERLYEGCDEAYVLKFDKDTAIQRLPDESKASEDKPASDKRVEPNTSKETSAERAPESSPNESGNGEKKEEVVCMGKESCKEYVKSFLAAIPIRELQDDIKKGLRASTPLHHRLQIEFHYTQFLQPVALCSAIVATAE